MARILLTSHGSTGDIYPVLAVAKALQQQGHRVRFATSPFFKTVIREAGVDFLPLPPDWEKEDFHASMRKMSQTRNPLNHLRIIYQSSAPYIKELHDQLDGYLDDTDILVGSYLFPHLRSLASNKNVPFALMAFCHNVVPSALIQPDPGPPPLPAWIPAPIRHGWHRFLWKAANHAITGAIKPVVNPDLKARGLENFKDFVFAPADRVLIMTSPGLFPLPADVSARFISTGYCRWQPPQEPETAASLQAFTEGQKVPVITFGSMSFDNANACLATFLEHWPTNRKIIIQAGWAEFKTEPRAQMKLMGSVAHDLLFRFASVVVHHGGAGTTASALHAGVPQIVVPHIADQFFWGRQVEHLGVGKVVARKHWPKRLAEALLALEKTPDFSERAKAHAQTLDRENGPETAAAAIEELF